MDTKELYTYWQEIEHYFDLAPVNGDVIYNELITALTAKDRLYHNAEHIQTILAHIDGYQLSIEGRITLILVAFYHDIVYLAGSKNNEEKSALQLEAHFTKHEREDGIVQRVAQIIRETKNHETEDELSQLFMDMDLAILGANPIRYQEYCQQIRMEFRNIPEFLYRRGRKRFVWKTLHQPPIFRTEHFRLRYETQAYENLSGELLEL